MSGAAAERSCWTADAGQVLQGAREEAQGRKGEWPRLVEIREKYTKKERHPGRQGIRGDERADTHVQCRCRAMEQVTWLHDTECRGSICKNIGSCVRHREMKGSCARAARSVECVYSRRVSSYIRLVCIAFLSTLVQKYSALMIPCHIASSHNIDTVANTFMPARSLQSALSASTASLLNMLQRTRRRRVKSTSDVLEASDVTPLFTLSSPPNKKRNRNYHRRAAKKPRKAGFHVTSVGARAGWTNIFSSRRSTRRRTGLSSSESCQCDTQSVVANPKPATVPTASSESDNNALAATSIVHHDASSRHIDCDLGLPDPHARVVVPRLISTESQPASLCKPPPFKLLPRLPSVKTLPNVPSLSTLRRASQSLSVIEPNRTSAPSLYPDSNIGAGLTPAHSDTSCFDDVQRYLRGSLLQKQALDATHENGEMPATAYGGDIGSAPTSVATLQEETVNDWLSRSSHFLQNASSLSLATALGAKVGQSGRVCTVDTRSVLPDDAPCHVGQSPTMLDDADPFGDHPHITAASNESRERSRSSSTVAEGLPDIEVHPCAADWSILDPRSSYRSPTGFILEEYIV